MAVTHRCASRAPRLACTSPRGTWKRPSGCSRRAWPSVVPPGKTSLGTIVGAWVRHMPTRDVSPRACALLEEARRDDLRTGRLGGSYVTHLRQLSAVYLLAGRFDEAWQHACQALDLARQLKARGNEAHALFQLGAVHAQASPPDVQQAEARYQEALTLAEALGMRPLQAHCHRGLGTLYAKTGQQEQARAALATAIELYRAMEMTFWLPQAEAALAAAEGIDHMGSPLLASGGSGPVTGPTTAVQPHLKRPVPRDMWGRGGRFDPTAIRASAGCRQLGMGPGRGTVAPHAHAAGVPGAPSVQGPYVFKHALTQEVAYESLLTTRRLLKGELLLQQSADYYAEAQACFQRVLDLARSHRPSRGNCMRHQPRSPLAAAGQVR